MSQRVPAKPKKSQSTNIKKEWKRSKSDLSLKDFARSLIGAKDKELSAMASNWIHNKTKNFSKPPLGIGNTKKKKNQQGGRR